MREEDSYNLEGSNVASYINTYVKSQPSANAFIAPSIKGKGKIEEITFEDLNIFVDRFAEFFLQQRILPGDKVVILIPLSIELYSSVLSLVKIGAIPVLYEAKELGSQLNATLDSLNPDAAFTLPKINFVLSLNSKYRKIKKRILLNRDLLSNNSAIREQNLRCFKVDPDSPALITFTSGSEGIPKGICRSHKVLRRQHEVLQKYIKLSNKDIVLTTLPVFALDMMASGATVIVPPLKKSLPWDTIPSETVRLLSTYNANMLMGSPAFLESFILWALHKKIKLNSIKQVYVGGGFLERNLIENLKATLPKDCILRTIYGSTEVEPISFVVPTDLDNYNDKYGFEGYCVGNPVQEIRLKIIKFKYGQIRYDELKTLPQGAIGEIIVAGPHVNDNYYPKEPAWSNNKIVDKEGTIWHRMGDAGYLDNKNYLWLVGRYKHLPDDAIQNYKPFLTLESELKKFPFVKRIAFMRTYKKPDKLVVECKNGNHVEYFIKKHQWKNIISKVCYNHQLKFHIELCRGIPLDRRHNSKIDYRKAKQKFVKFED